MVQIRNLLPQARRVTLDALKGKQRPGRPLGKVKEQPGGIDYEQVQFGPYRGQGLRRGVTMPDTMRLPKGGEQSSAIVEGIRQGTFRLVPDVKK